MKIRTRVFAGVLTLSGALAGCGADALDDAFSVEEAESIEVTQSAITAAGCAALTQTSEGHTGALLGYATSHREMVVKQVKFTVRNPSTTDCGYAQVSFQLTNDLTGRVLRSHTFEVSIAAKKGLIFTWNVNFDSRTYTPKVDYGEDVWTYSNGRLLKATYLPAYFIDTNQY